MAAWRSESRDTCPLRHQHEVGGDEQRIRALHGDGRKGRVKILGLDDAHRHQPHSESLRGALKLAEGERRVGILRVPQHGNASDARLDLPQQFETLAFEDEGERRKSRHVSARLGEAVDEARGERIADRAPDDWDRGGCLLKGERRSRPPAREQDIDLPLDELARQGRQPVKLTLGLAVDERHGLSLAEPLLAERAAKGIERRTDTSRRTEHPDLRLARPRLREGVIWPQVDGRRSTAGSCNDLPPSHSITSSARARRDGGVVRPRALAAFRLMTSSTFVTWWTGKLAGFSPLRILPV